MPHIRRWRRFALTVLAAGGCGGSNGPAVLHGQLAFPVVIVNESPSPMMGQGGPDGGWPGILVDLQNYCLITDGPTSAEFLKDVFLQIWNPDGGSVGAGTWPLIDPNTNPASGSAFLFYRGAPGGAAGVGGSLTLTEAGPAFVGSFVTTISGQSLSGTFSTSAPNQCACTPLAGGGKSCPVF